MYRVVCNSKQVPAEYPNLGNLEGFSRRRVCSSRKFHFPYAFPGSTFPRKPAFYRASGCTCDPRNPHYGSVLLSSEARNPHSTVCPTPKPAYNNKDRKGRTYIYISPNWKPSDWLENRTIGLISDFFSRIGEKTKRNFLAACHTQLVQLVTYFLRHVFSYRENF